MFVITFNDTGAEGVMIFSATNMEDALRFTQDTNHFTRPDRASNPIPFDGGIEELHKMFPLKRKTVEEIYRLLSLKRRESKKII